VSNAGVTTTDFTRWFRSLVAVHGARQGWYGVFAGREPDAAHAYERGSQIPPWDVVRAVLHDLAAARGAAPDPAEMAGARDLYVAAVTAWDAVPGAEQDLRARLEAAVRAHDVAVLRERESARALDNAAAAPASAATDRLVSIHAWARDDRERAAARRDDLHARLAALRSRPQTLPPAPGQAVPHGYADARGPRAAARSAAGPAPGEAAAAAWWTPATPSGPAADRDPARSGTPGAGQSSPARWDAEPGSRAGGGAPVTGTADPAAGAPGDEPGPEPGGRPERAPSWRSGAGRKPGRSAARPRGARFAGAGYDDADDAVDAAPAGPIRPQRAPRGARFAGAPAAEAAGPVPVAVPGTAPRGARFAGAPAAASRPGVTATDQRWSAQARAEAARLGELRAAGQSGAAYVVLCEAASGPAERLPHLLREVERVGLAADAATLLWEVAGQPPVPLAAAAAALAAAGRTGDCRTLLRQAAARPPADLAAVAAALTGDAARDDAAGQLLETLAGSRPPEDAAAVVAAHPPLAGPLLAAAGRISPSRRHDISAALRRNGLPAT
jgi:hypothetical protein